MNSQGTGHARLGESCWSYTIPIVHEIKKNNNTQKYTHITSCRRAAFTTCPRAPPLSCPRERRSASRRRADDNVAAVSYGQHVPTLKVAAAWRANTAVSKTAWWPWPLTFWPWKWCPSHVGYLCANCSLPRPLCSRLRPDVRVRRQTDRRQTSDSIIALCPRLLWVGHNHMHIKITRVKTHTHTHTP